MVINTKKSDASWLDKNFLRRRLFFFSRIKAVRYETPYKPVGFDVERYSIYEIVEYRDYIKWVPEVLVQVNEKKFCVDTYFLIDQGSRLPVGAASALRVRDGSSWYDNVPMRSDEVRLVGLKILPDYRGRGFGRFLQRQFFHNVTRFEGVRWISAIVEDHRIPSIRSQAGVFDHTTQNWLIKIFGRNLVSIITGGMHKGIWYVGPGHGGQWRNDV